MKKTRWPLMAAGLGMLVLSALWVLVPDRALLGSDGGRGGDRVVRQAAWEVQAYPAAGATGLTPAAKQTVAREREAVVGAIQCLYDALFLDRDSVERVVRSSLSPAASKALESSRIGLGDQVDDVRTTTRVVRVGIQADDGLRAAAVVRVRATALRRSSPIDVWHRANLWMEKAKGRWKVVGFDAEQGRVR